MRVLNCVDPMERGRALTAAASSITAGELVIFPTEAAYVVGTDAFSPPATDGIRKLRGIGLETPLQVLVKSAAMMDGVASMASDQAKELAVAFWPGALTLIVPKSPSIHWQIGGDERYVQLRVPLHPVALELISECGPVVTSVAKKSGGQAVTRAQDAVDLEQEVAVFLDYEELVPAPRSTILDCTSDRVRILRPGSVTADQLADVLGYEPV
ncbi:MAG TPA: L-threonylcarbamoyladenylate synthase [Kineosporiaceae bacterium]|nr:L-threonylcarbamoyladenylate synthase [Kineosporiaceae bacterium]